MYRFPFFPHFFLFFFKNFLLLVVTCGHSWSLMVTRGHSWSLMVIRGHSWSLALSHGHSRSFVVTHGHSYVVLVEITFSGIISSVVAIFKDGNRKICCRLRIFILLSIANLRIRDICLSRGVGAEENPIPILRSLVPSPAWSRVEYLGDLLSR